MKRPCLSQLLSLLYAIPKSVVRVSNYSPAITPIQMRCIHHGTTTEDYSVANSLKTAADPNKKNKKKTHNYPPFVIPDTEIEEKFARGGGPGGQSINKSMNKVQLTHIPTGISVACQETRDLTSNRAIARRLLREKVEYAQLGDNSKKGRSIEKTRKRKRNSARRAKKKYGNDSKDAVVSTWVDEEPPVDDDISSCDKESDNDDDDDDDIGPGPEISLS